MFWPAERLYIVWNGSTASSRSRFVGSRASRAACCIYRHQNFLVFFPLWIVYRQNLITWLCMTEWLAVTPSNVIILHLSEECASRKKATRPIPYSHLSAAWWLWLYDCCWCWWSPKIFAAGLLISGFLCQPVNWHCIQKQHDRKEDSSNTYRLMFIDLWNWEAI